MAVAAAAETVVVVLVVVALAVTKRLRIFLCHQRRLSQLVVVALSARSVRVVQLAQIACFLRLPLPAVVAVAA